MNKKKLLKLFLLLMTVICVLIGCGKEETAVSGTEETEDIFSDLVTEDGLEAVYTSITIEAGVENGPGNRTFTYDGSPIEFDYSISTEGNCKVGLKLYVNGFSQVYEVDGEETVMHVEELDSEVKKLHVSFQPVDGKKGDKVSLLFTNILNPEIIEPNSSGNVVFGNSHSMSSPLDWYIEMEEDCSTGHDLAGKTQAAQVSCREFTKEEREAFIHSDVSGNRKDDLDYFRCEIGDGEETDGTIISQSEKTVKVKLYGGDEGTYRVSFYSNFELLEIDGKSYFDIKVKDGQETAYELALEDIPAGKDFYAMAIAVDLDNSWNKSKSYYISE